MAQISTCSEAPSLHCGRLRICGGPLGEIVSRRRQGVSIPNDKDPCYSMIIDGDRRLSYILPLTVNSLTAKPT